MSAWPRDDPNMDTHSPEGPRLLVVDDEENVAYTLAEILRQDGAAVDVALNGEDALRCIRGLEYDVVLSDLRMDDVDGVSVISEARRRSPTTATIILTGFASLESAVAAMRQGAYDYLIKPCVIDDLKNTVRRGLERRRLFREIQEARRNLEQINRELEQRIELKTAELRRVNDDLSRANHAKDVFFATLSHELRTPLTPILGWMRVLRSTKATAPLIEKGLEVIERNAILQMRLIDDLLDVSRLISGKLELDRQPTDLRDVVSNALETVREKATEGQVVLSAELPDTPVVVMGSDVRLHQIIWNLLSNAIKFTDPGGSVSLSLAFDRGEAHVFVTDTGAGIAPDFLPRLFELFSQGEDEKARRKGSGMGLGLAIARRLAEMHNGWIRAESGGAGKGSRFTFGLPVAQTQTVPRQADRAPVERRRELHGSVLVVDDSADTLEMLRVLFTGRGLRVLTASGAEAALALLSREKPRVVIANLEMRQMDGFAFLEAMRRMPGRQDVPVIAVSSDADEISFLNAMKAGFAAYIVKPFESDQLVNTIDAIVTRQRAMRR